MWKEGYFTMLYLFPSSFYPFILINFSQSRSYSLSFHPIVSPSLIFTEFTLPCREGEERRDGGASDGDRPLSSFTFPFIAAPKSWGTNEWEESGLESVREIPSLTPHFVGSLRSQARSRDKGRYIRKRELVSDLFPSCPRGWGRRTVVGRGSLTAYHFIFPFTLSLSPTVSRLSC